MLYSHACCFSNELFGLKERICNGLPNLDVIFLRIHDCSGGVYRKNHSRPGLHLDPFSTCFIFHSYTDCPNRETGGHDLILAWAEKVATEI